MSQENFFRHSGKESRLVTGLNRQCRDVIANFFTMTFLDRLSNFVNCVIWSHLKDGMVFMAISKRITIEGVVIY